MIIPDISSTFLGLLLLLFPFYSLAEVSPRDSEIDSARRITEIEILGLTRSDKQIVLRELLFQVGDIYNQSAIDQSIQRLRNLRIFSSVNWQVNYNDENSVKLSIHLQERWTLIPIAKFNEGGDTMYYVLGLYNVNSFGQYFETGAQYESWNNQPGAVLWFREPRFLNKRILLGGDIWSVKRPRALYQANGIEQGSYVAFRKRFNGFMEYEIHQRLQLGLGVEAIEDDIIATKEDSLLNSGIKSHLDNFKPARNIIVSIRGQLGKLDRQNEILAGETVEFSAGYSSTKVHSDDNFYKFDIDAKSFRRPRQNDNLALRLKVGSTNSEKLPFYYFLGGFDNVRGYLDGQIRARHFWQTNVEYRHTFVKRAWYYGQSLLFADAIQAIHPDSELEQNNSDIFSSIGLGLRFGSPKIYRFNLRMDIALITSHPASSRFSMGVQQFF